MGLPLFYHKPFGLGCTQQLQWCLSHMLCALIERLSTCLNHSINGPSITKFLLALQVPEMLEGIADGAPAYTLNTFLRWQYPDD